MKCLILLLSALGLGTEAATAQQDDLDGKYATELLVPGTQAPDFTLKDIDGKEFSISDFKGKTVVLVFWASWCPDCRAEVPQLKQIAASANPVTTVFVQVSFDRSLEALRSFSVDNALPGVLLFDPAGKKESKVGADYHVKWIPSLYIIDPEGKIKLGTVMIEKVAAALKPAKAARSKGLFKTRKKKSGTLCSDESCAL